MSLFLFWICVFKCLRGSAALVDSSSLHVRRLSDDNTNTNDKDENVWGELKLDFQQCQAVRSAISYNDMEAMINAKIKAGISGAKDRVHNVILSSISNVDINDLGDARTTADKTVDDAVKVFANDLQKRVQKDVKQEVTEAVATVIKKAIGDEGHFLSASSCAITPKFKYDQLSALEFRDQFQKNQEKIIMRRCKWCDKTYRKVFYKRIKPLPKLDHNIKNTDKDWRLAEILTSFWTDDENKLGDHFKLYSFYEDAKNDKNAWEWCDYTDKEGIGFPFNCAPKKPAEGAEKPNQNWNSWTKEGQNNKNVAFCLAKPVPVQQILEGLNEAETEINAMFFGASNFHSNSQQLHSHMAPASHIHVIVFSSFCVGILGFFAVYGRNKYQNDMISRPRDADYLAIPVDEDYETDDNEE